MTGFRLSGVELAQLQEVAEVREVPVAHLLYRLVMPQVKEEWLQLQGGTPAGEVPAPDPEA